MAHDPSTNPRTTSVAAELHVIVDQAERLRERVGSLAEPLLGGDRDDLVAAIHEAERQLLMATRSLQRALKTAR
ncbi:MAG TPA: hypothetical protein VNQ73_09845 [Ilumatobacter sp.]|nr:hypothetical protein [Ilumatobacter sp.]